MRKPTIKEAIGLILGSPIFIVIYCLALPFKLIFKACNYLDEVFPL